MYTIETTIENTTVPDKSVVRLRTSVWLDSRGLHSRKTLTLLKRKSSGRKLLFADAEEMGAEYVAPRILNLDLCDDGVYEVVACNEHRDWETGLVDDYDYRLRPYTAGPI